MTGARLHTNLIDQAQRQGDAIAFRCGRETLAYGELDERSSRLAAALTESGVRRGERVAIRLAPGVHSPIAVYGILKAGAAMVPIDPMAPPSRVAQLVREGSIGHLVTSGIDEVTCDCLGESPLTTVVGCTGSDPKLRFISWEEVDAHDSSVASGISDTDAAYVIFTSGSTGVPKGIVHTHQSGQAYARLSTETYGVRPGDRIAN
ncbi:MAG: AMP-binding protein, partial [Planctomycetota bacterium]